MGEDLNNNKKEEKSSKVRGFVGSNDAELVASLDQGAAAPSFPVSMLHRHLPLRQSIAALSPHPRSRPIIARQGHHLPHSTRPDSI